MRAQSIRESHSKITWYFSHEFWHCIRHAGFVNHWINLENISDYDRPTDRRAYYQREWHMYDTRCEHLKCCLQRCWSSIIQELSLENAPIWATINRGYPISTGVSRAFPIPFVSNFRLNGLRFMANWFEIVYRQWSIWCLT